MDISSEEDWRDIEPYRDATSGLLGCKVGKFDFFEPVTLQKFVIRLIDAGLFFGQDEGEIRELKRKYGL